MGSGSGRRGGRTRLPVSQAAPLAAAVVVLVLGWVGVASSAGAATNVTLTAAPKWGDAPAGTWTPYSVTVRNDGGNEVEGEVVLTARPEPPPKPGARPRTVTTASPGMGTVVALGDRAMTTPPPSVPAPPEKEPVWPVYRAPVAVPSGSEKTLTVMVLQGKLGFGVELVDGKGRVLAGAVGPAPAGSTGLAVLLLSGSEGAEARLEALPGQLTGGLDVIQLRESRDFPDVALHLAGLDGVVIDDFDTAALTARQLRALQDYVSLGGSLVVAGGAAYSRILPSLPRGLTPLDATASTSASLAPLADQLGGTTTATTEVATGPVRAGRVVLGSPEGPPLVVEADYRAGRVIQLAFDPLAEPIASDLRLEVAAWNQALSRVASRWGYFLTRDVPPVAGEGQLWASALKSRRWPSWPLPATAVLAVYALLLGPAAFALSRRARPALGWVALTLAVPVMAGTTSWLARPVAEGTENVVEVSTLGADGTVMTTTYRGLLGIDPPRSVPLPPGAASTIFSGRGAFRRVAGQADPLSPSILDPAPNRGVGGGTVAGGTNPSLRLRARPWQLRTIETVSVADGGPQLEAALRLVGASGASPGRVQGTVTNRGPVAIGQLRAQVQEGQARLPDLLGPGETIQVDSPILTTTRPTAKQGLLAASTEEAVMFSAAARSFTGPEQTTLVGTLPADAVAGPGRIGRRISVVTATVPLESAETVPSGAGGFRNISASPLVSQKEYVHVVELSVPPGTGPLSISYLAQQPPAQELPRATREVYSWVKGTWRPLPLTGKPSHLLTDAPLEAGEVRDGVVRFRSRGSDLLSTQAFSHLLLTTTSEAQAKSP